jgi:hypothetical protein
LTIKWQLGVSVVWQDAVDSNGVICAAPSMSVIKGAIPTILRLGGPKNAAMIAVSEV